METLETTEQEQYGDSQDQNTQETSNETQDQNKEEKLDVRKVINRIEQKLNDVGDDVNAVVESNDIKSDSPLFSAKNFTDFGLSENILQGIYAMHYNRPSKIQGLAIPVIISNPPQNFIGQAQSGTGKTAAFILSIIARVDQSLQETQALCVAPTRELTRQIFDVAQKLARFTEVKIALAIPEERAPRVFTQHLVIGTPGKMFEHIDKRRILTRNIRMLVLDEADEMLDVQGLQDQTIKIKRKMPNGCQVCLFSATYNNEVKKFAQKIVPAPKISILIPQEKLSLDALTQLYINCKNEDHKLIVLKEIYGFVLVGQSIIFTESRYKAQQVHDYMKEKGFEVSLLHGGNMPPTERDKVIDDFRKGLNRVLVTTNLLSRGVDVLQVSMVINFDIPVLPPGDRSDPESYLHRIGRSGRYGNPGLAINFVHDYKSKRHLECISEYFQKPVEELKFEELEKVGEIMEKMATYYPEKNK